MCPSTSLFLHEFLLHIKNSTPTPLFFALTLSLFLSLPCQSAPRSFMYMHTSPRASAAALSGFLGGDRWRGESEMKRQTEREERGKGKEDSEGERVWQKVRERGGEREWNTSNSQRQAAFPWQRGFHRNSPAKDAISEEQKEKCHSPLIWRAHIRRYTQTYQSPTCVYTCCCYTNKHKHTHTSTQHKLNTRTHKCIRPHGALFPLFNSQLNTHPAAASPLPTQELKLIQTYTNLSHTCD